MFESFVTFVRDLYGEPTEVIPLHAPRFSGTEQQYVREAIDSTVVSSVGAYVDLFEERLATWVGAAHAVAVVSGTSALQVALRLAGVAAGDLVITQPLTFVATGNAIRYQGADPLFVDVDATTLGLSPARLEDFLAREATVDGQGQCRHRKSGRRIAACLPVHTLGHPVAAPELLAVGTRYHLPLVEDAAESLGSYYQGQHTGTFGMMGTLSFNGNKIITCGGGGAIITDDPVLAARARHLTTQAKVAHPWEYWHDEVGYNYRMPNLNAALGCAQLESLPRFLADKRRIAQAYADFFAAHKVPFITESEPATSNYWLNAVLLPTRAERDAFLTYTHHHRIITRPAWPLLHRLPMFADALRDDLSVAEDLADRLVSIPSSTRST